LVDLPLCEDRRSDVSNSVGLEVDNNRSPNCAGVLFGSLSEIGRAVEARRAVRSVLERTTLAADRSRCGSTEAGGTNRIDAKRSDMLTTCSQLKVAVELQESRMKMKG
jgi:hypothetical protein